VKAMPCALPAHRPHRRAATSGRGHGLPPGTPLMTPGTRIGPAQIALAITAGLSATSRVRRQVKLAVIDSGDELAVPGSPLRCLSAPRQQQRDAGRHGSTVSRRCDPDRPGA